MRPNAVYTSEDNSDQKYTDDRKQDTKVENAFQAVHDRIDSLGNASMNLLDRLVLVTNNYPRPEIPIQAKNDGPTGDSELVNRLYELNEKLSRITDRLNDVMERLDI